MHVARDPVLGISQQFDLRNARADAIGQRCSQGSESCGLQFTLGLGLFCGYGEGRSTGDILSSGPQPALLAATVQERCEPRTARDDERTRADRGADLVSGDTQRHEAHSPGRCTAQLSERHRQVSEGGDGIQVERHIVLGGRATEPARIVDGADLVVREQRRCEGRTGQCLSEGVDANVSLEIQRNGANLRTRRGERCHGVECGVMLAIRQHDRVAFLCALSPEAREREVDRLGSPRSEDDFDRLAVEHGGDALARLFQQAAHGLPRTVRRRGVPDDRLRLQPGVRRAGPERCRRRVVEVDGHPFDGTATPPTFMLSSMCPHAPATVPDDARREALCSLCSSAFDDLGVRIVDGVGTLRVWSSNATGLDLVLFDGADVDWAIAELRFEQVGEGVWEVRSPQLQVGSRYAIRVTGAQGGGNSFRPHTNLIDPYSRGLVRAGGQDDWRSVVVDDSFDWDGAQKPRTPFADTVIYEGHVKGMTKRHPGVPPALHGTYAGLAHPAMIEHFSSLGITAVELLPVHAFVSEPWLQQRGFQNYWGYNTLNFFTPHAAYATTEARRSGPDAVLREFKGMVKLLHEAGIEVILDVVYNHTSEGGPNGPRTSLRGIDNARYYRQLADGEYVDTTACGNTLNTSTDAAARLVLDSLRYWAEDLQVDGFRFDLATALGRDATHTFTASHPLLQAIRTDPVLAETKLIAEPWDVGTGGWQTGNFGQGWHEWNDRYRDRVRNFWLSDIDYARRASTAPVGIGGFATRLAGSSNTFSSERGPLASVNFVTAHDGFTLRDLVSYNVKHNEANGEENRDGAEMNRAFNHGAEGPTQDPVIEATRRKAMRNLMGTLLLSAGVPMITAGDETGRTQQGNNNAYCHDSPLTWLSWEHEEWQECLRAHVATLTRLRRENPALRPTRYARLGEETPGASEMSWFDQSGTTMSIEQWTDASHRTLQYLAVEDTGENPNRVLLIVHGVESAIDVTLPTTSDATRYVSLWSSADERPSAVESVHAPGDVIAVPGTSMRLFRVE